MKLLKKAAAALLAVCTAFGCASCGENTANAMTVDGYDVRAGIYLYYVTSAYSEAINVLSEGGQSFDEAKTTKDIKAIMSKSKIDNVSAETWIQNKAAEHCTDFVEVEREFDALGLTLTGEQLAQIKAQTATYMNYCSEFYKDSGISEQSVKDVITNEFKQDAIWEAYYGEDGSVGVKDSDMIDYYADNHLRIKYIAVSLKDGEGNLLKGDDKKAREAMAEDYLSRANKKAGDEAALMKEMDYLIEEETHYQTSLSEAAVTTTDDQGGTITTATTAKATTNEKGETDTTAPAEDGTGTETTTTTASAEDGTDLTTETTGAVTTETTTTAEPEDTTTTTTTTANGLGYDTAQERILQVSTSSTDTKSDNSETEAEPTYTPCKAVYEWAADESTPLLKPIKILSDDEETIYIAVKMDIYDRLTPEDLWTDGTKESVRNEMYYDEFSDMMREKADKLPVSRNEKAFKRYKVLDVDIVEFQNEMMQYYYSMYNFG
ncbi:MAG: hypothetical protein IJ060_00005 [Oscillospiraceae bacterium]|nr:hypothetical protein [Oscillospiraceae bacterium]